MLNNGVYLLMSCLYMYLYKYVYLILCTHTHTHTHILPVKSIWQPSKIFISHPKNVIFNETNETPQCFYLSY